MRAGDGQDRFILRLGLQDRPFLRMTGDEPEGAITLGFSPFGEPERESKSVGLWINGFGQSSAGLSLFHLPGQQRAYGTFNVTMKDGSSWNPLLTLKVPRRYME